MEQNIIYKKPEGDEIPKAKELILEYIEWLNLDLSFQSIDEEMKDFPGKYQEPDGAFIIAKENNNVIGCIGIKKLDKTICEMKRLFGNDKYKGKGIGKKLVGLIIADAQSKQYEKMRLDTLDYMKSALNLYQKNGFYEIAPYYHNPVKGVVYLEREL
jgi:N-acetylglutamate synthase-like GNAT family acetyltransferase